MKPRRLDVELVERSLAESREQAQRLILAGEVWVEGQRWDKASKLCAASAAIEVRGGDRYVRRGGRKMEGALTGFPLDVAGWRCLDLGPENLVGNLGQHARAIAGFRIGIHRAAMNQIADAGQRLAQDRVGALALDAGDHADPAGVVFKGRIVESVKGFCAV